MKKKISIIIPIYNEEAILNLLYNKINTVIEQINSKYVYEIIFINDGSRDSSWQIISNFAASDSHIKAINFSRNFGQQMALTAGYDYASGDAIITLDADLQDPPHLIVEMIEAWEKGSKIVYAKRIERNDSFLKNVTAKLYCRFLDYMSDIKIPYDVGDFRLIDKVVLQALRSCREKSRFLRGMVAWTGFTYTFVNFTRPERNTGKSAYTWAKLFKIAVDGLTGFSLFPLKLAAFVGIFVTITGMLMFSYITLDALFFDGVYPLFKWLVTIIYIFMGVQFGLLWLIGEYIGRIHDQLKNRPLYIIEETIDHDLYSMQKSEYMKPQSNKPVNTLYF